MKNLVPDVVKLKVKDLKNWDKNPREIEESQFEALKDLIKKFGFMGTLKVDKDTNEVLGGNMRLKAARDLEVEELNCEIVDVHSIAFDNGQTYDDAKLEVALVDNNQFGHYVRDQLLALIPEDTKININVMRIDLNPMTIGEVIKLDGFNGEQESTEGDLENFLNEKQETATLTFVVTGEQKGVILKKLHEIKDDMLLEKDGDALYELCKGESDYSNDEDEI